MNRLHVVNGDIFARTLEASPILGKVLAWRESLIDGPVRADVYHQESLRQRASYFSRYLGVAEHEFLAASSAQLRVLEQWSTYDEIVLWFEYDLYDQAMLMSLLCWFHEQFTEDRVGHGKTSNLKRPLIRLMELAEFPGIDDFRGFSDLTVEQLPLLESQWRTLSDQDIEAGARAWKAFASDDPRELAKLVLAGIPSFPLMQAALTYHFSRFPDPVTGTSALEWDILQVLDQAGGMSPLELFRYISKRHRMYGLGDLSFWNYIERMRSATTPLVAVFKQDHKPFDASVIGYASVDDLVVKIAPAGKQVLPGIFDYGRVSKKERWLGGACHDGTVPNWRWNRTEKRFLLL